MVLFTHLICLFILSSHFVGVTETSQGLRDSVSVIEGNFAFEEDSVDPELALALRLSLEDAQQQRPLDEGEGDGNGGNGGNGADDEDAMLQRALEMSMEETKD